MSFGTKIIGTGSGLPSRVMHNAELETFLDTSDEWIRTRTGIETRRIANPEKGETSFTMARQAAEQALEMAGRKGSDLDAIIVGTITPDTVMPNTANQLQAVLGASRAFSFDLQAACSGFAYGMSIIDQYMRLGTIRTALVIGVETLSTLVDWRDRSTAVLFGDAAGAVVFERTEDPDHRVIDTRIFSDGRLGELLCIPHGFGKVPPYRPEYQLHMHKIKMRGNEVFKVAVRNMVDASKKIMQAHKISKDDIDLFIFHQANLRIIDSCAESLNIDKRKLWLNVQKYGNTSAATLPVSLDEAWRSGTVKQGDLILMATFGGGLTWASALIRL
ncbi:MAG: ketoacyl-ACP synthase III [Deltaproteobacteria bacterium]|nr:ketoacyl-ACP synthase III [Deltaproteobacteria bacterium]